MQRVQIETQPRCQFDLSFQKIDTILLAAHLRNRFFPPFTVKIAITSVAGQQAKQPVLVHRDQFAAQSFIQEFDNAGVAIHLQPAECKSRTEVHI